jgi:hypothetical protein
LISHGHSPPSRPPPDLEFDVRSLPNPPKHTRESYNGTSKRLQELLEPDDRFQTRKNEIRTVIETAIKGVIDKKEKNNVESTSDIVKNSNDILEREDMSQSAPTNIKLEDQGEEEVEQTNDDNNSSKSSPSAAQEFRVGIIVLWVGIEMLQCLNH